jgi:hypothetical protein
MWFKKSVLPYFFLMMILSVTIAVSGCMNARIDRFVAKQYGTQPTHVPKKRDSSIVVSSPITISSGLVSSTVSRTSHVLPLLFYWQLDYKITCTLNPAIPVRNFTNTVLSESRKLNEKLNGRHLELSVDELPHIFAIDDKEHMVWLIYAFSWNRASIQPELNDMTITYRVLENNNLVKSGKIVVTDEEKGQGLRMFQSWKNATASYLARYNYDITAMTRTFVNELVKEL